MFDVGGSELLLIGVVALIVVGPKDLPVMFHSLGRMTAKARAMAREFSRAMEDAAKESGLDAAAKGLKDIKDITKNPGVSALERATEKFEKWDPMKAPPTMPKGPVPPAAPSAAVPTRSISGSDAHNICRRSTASGSSSTMMVRSPVIRDPWG